MNLAELKPRIETYIKFAKQFPPAYRAPIFSYLLAGGDAQGREVAATAREPEATAAPAAPTGVPAPMAAAAPVPVTVSADGVYEAIAERAGLQPTEVRRVLSVADGEITIKAILEEDTKARRQLAYSILYLYALERTGREAASSDELRAICVAKRCYDRPNFTRNYKFRGDWIARYGEPGSQEQEWMLTREGRTAARELLRRLAGGEGPGTAGGDREVKPGPTDRGDGKGTDLFKEGTTP